MFEKFTEGAIKVIMLAQEEARRMGHNFVGTEQLLLGVIGQRHGVGGRALSQLNVTLKKTRKAVEKYIGRGTGFVASEIPFTPRAKRVLETSIQEAQDLGVNYVGTEHILLSLINEVDGIASRTLDKLGVNIPKLKHLILTYIEEQQEDVLNPPLTDKEKWAVARNKGGSKTPHLDEYTSNLTKLAVEGKLDPVIGREKEIKGLLKVLCRRRKNNPVLLGEAGVGKTACAEGLAQILVDSQDIPVAIRETLLLVLDLGAVLAGTKYRGEFEERIKRILEEVEMQGKITLVIDEIHTLVGAGAAEGAVDAANLLKPALARGSLRLIGATTVSEYRRYIEKDPALERRFQPIIVEEPDVETTIKILFALKQEFEAHHALYYDDACFKKAAELSNRYITDRNLPDKAIDVTDEAGSRVRLENRQLPEAIQALMVELATTLNEKKNAIKYNNFTLAKELAAHEMEVRMHMRIMNYAVVSNPAYFNDPTRQNIERVLEDDVCEVVSLWTGVPTTKMKESESERLLNLEHHLHERLIGQHHAIVAVSKAVRRARAGLADPKRPLASFIFAGPTGVGKTELTKTLAEYMFDTEDNLIRFDMSEYMEKHTVAKLIGSPPGYVGFQEGGQLTEAVRLKPFSIVLFDEVEKAHPDVFNIFLQILDDGHLTDSAGRKINFKNTIIVMTTNLGAAAMEELSPILPKGKREDIVTLRILPNGAEEIVPPEDPSVSTDDPKFALMEERVKEALKRFFRPEFLNRLDDIIVFHHLTKNNLWEICALLLESLGKRVREKDMMFECDTAVQYFLTLKGYDPVYGARPLRRAITRLLEDKMADICIAMETKAGMKIRATLETNSKAAVYSDPEAIDLKCDFNTYFSDEIDISIDDSGCANSKKVLKNWDALKLKAKEDKRKAKQDDMEDVKTIVKNRGYVL